MSVDTLNCEVKDSAIKKRKIIWVKNVLDCATIVDLGYVAFGENNIGT